MRGVPGRFRADGAVGGGRGLAAQGQPGAVLRGEVRRRGLPGVDRLQHAARRAAQLGRARRCRRRGGACGHAGPVRPVPQGVADQPAEPEGDPVLHLVLHPVRRSGLRLPRAVVWRARAGVPDLQLCLPDHDHLRGREAGRGVPAPPPAVGRHGQRGRGDVHRLRRQAGHGHDELSQTTFSNPDGFPDYRRGPQARRTGP
ncbi:hypothetical protein CBM2626_A140160 [Cupriavidus taiwanensis]|nr:hypothetical protein CBM2626_A140160 [Cupriavidus taiwanensis]